MEKLDSILSSLHFNCNIKGVWYVVQWSPSLITDERINIGVIFKDNQSQEVSVQMLDYFERAKSLYSKNVKFNLELACNVARELVLNGSDIDSTNLTSQLVVIKKGFAQGKSHSEVLSSLYGQVVTMSKPIVKRNKSNFISKSRDTIYNEIKDDLKINLSLDYELHVPDNPYQQINEHGFNQTIYIPYKKNNGVATLISTVYSDVQRVKCNLFDGYRDVDVALNNKTTKNNAIFLILPDNNLSRSNKIEVENEIDKFYWLIKRHNIYVGSHVRPNDLANDISDWCLNDKVA